MIMRLDVTQLNSAILCLNPWSARDKRVTGPPPISTFMKHKHSVSFLVVSRLSPVLKDACKAAHPVLEDALDTIKSEVIPDPCNRLFNSIA
jgi:hypothetical protein